MCSVLNFPSTRPTGRSKSPHIGNLNFAAIKPILAKESRNFNSFSGPHTVQKQLKFLLFSFFAGPIRVFSNWAPAGPAIHLSRMNPAHLILAVHDIKKQNATNNHNKYNITVTISARSGS
ncbi:hypothetical protein B0H13DRAFT_1886003 [Mycena leptocephala]|nr:hypothetical protein B0H13DRAFT_1886003 [Mycena leptocephala]